MHTGSTLNSATTDDEDFGRKHRTQSDETEGSGDDEFYDATYFGEYDDEDESDGDSDGDGDAHSSDENDSASPPGDVDMTEPPPFIIEEEIATWNNKFGGSSGDKKTSGDKHGNNDIDFEDNNDGSKDRKPSNVHNPNDRSNSNGNNNSGSNKRITNAATKASADSKISALLISNVAFIVAAKVLVGA